MKNFFLSKEKIFSYSPESIESQMRRMADLAFLFGLYSFSYQIYQSLKKEFANDQAWVFNSVNLNYTKYSPSLPNPAVPCRSIGNGSIGQLHE